MLSGRDTAGLVLSGNEAAGLVLSGNEAAGLVLSDAVVSPVFDPANSRAVSLVHVRVLTHRLLSCF